MAHRSLFQRPVKKDSAKSSYRQKRSLRGLRLEKLEGRDLMAANLLAIDPLEYDPTRVLAQFRSVDGAFPQAGTPIAGATVGRQFASEGWFELQVGAGQTVSSVLSNLSTRADVLASTPDFKITANLTPNDPSYPSLWGMEQTNDADIDASTAWDFGTSSSVVVAVIDSGIDYNHVDLVPNIWTNSDEISGNGIDDDANGYIDDTRGWNFVSNNNNPMDDNGHGTHVAGTIGAVGNNGIGVAGVAWNVKVMALKFLDASGSGSLSGAVAAVDYARVNGAKIINASWGGGGFNTALNSALQRFQNAGGIFVAAAGNEAANNAVVGSYPANYNLPSVVSVAASSQTDTLASFSNFGTNVDIAAPGVSILSTYPGNRYARLSGTSMATPHVAGAMALLWGQSPSLTSTQLIDLVMQNTDNVLRDRTIYGRMNLGKAALALQASTTPDTTGPTVSGATWNAANGSLSSVDIQFSESIQATSVTLSSIQLTGPNGSIAATSVTPTNANRTVWRVVFPTQSAVGTYQLTVLPTALDTAGNLMDQDRDAIPGELNQDNFSSSFVLEAIRNYTNSTATAIRDATRTQSGVTTIALNVPDAVTIADLNVDLSINHTYVSDLRIRLIAPNGTSVQLVNRRGGSSDNIRVLFDDEASSSIATVTSNLSGTFRSEQSLSAFDGLNAQGRWTLEIVDLARLDAGTFNSLTLRITPAASVAAATTTENSGDTFSLTVQTWFDWMERQLRRLRS